MRRAMLPKMRDTVAGYLSFRRVCINRRRFDSGVFVVGKGCSDLGSDCNFGSGVSGGCPDGHQAASGRICSVSCRLYRSGERFCDLVALVRSTGFRLHSDDRDDAGGLFGRDHRRGVYALWHADRRKAGDPPQRRWPVGGRGAQPAFLAQIKPLMFKAAVAA